MHLQNKYAENVFQDIYTVHIYYHLKYIYFYFCGKISISYHDLTLLLYSNNFESVITFSIMYFSKEVPVSKMRLQISASLLIL